MCSCLRQADSLTQHRKSAVTGKQMSIYGAVSGQLGPCSCLTQIVCYKSTVTGQQISMQLVWPDYVLPKMSAVKGQVCGSK